MGKGSETAVNKGNSAFVKNILDGSVTESGSAEGSTDVQYDVEFKIGAITYGINSETGQFFRNDQGKTLYAQIEDGLFMQVKTRLGIRSMAS